MSGTNLTARLLNASYAAVTTAALPLVLAGFFLSPRGRIRLSERLGKWKFDKPSDVVWFHGASAGEVNGLLPIMQQFRSAFPSRKLLLTATSLSGLSVGKHLADFERLLPFDCDFLIKRALSSIKPKAFIGAETEIWPNLIQVLAQEGIPVTLVNARISEFTYPYYRALRPIVKQALQKCSAICASNEEVAQRFHSLGADKNLKILGNAKYDLQPRFSSVKEVEAFRLMFFTSDLPTITLGSLRPGEERVWFPALKDLVEEGRINVIVAPRHKEKFLFFEGALKRFGLTFGKRSDQRATDQSILLLDTFGELESVYSFSELAFVGGSIARFGGHNPMEAAAYGCALLIGPHYGNVKEIVESLLSNDGIKIVANEIQARETLDFLLSNSSQLAAMREKAFNIWKEHSGASGRIFEFLRQEVFAKARIFSK